MKSKRYSGSEKYNNQKKIHYRGLKNRLKLAEKIISKLEDKIIEIIESEEQKKNLRIQKNSKFDKNQSDLH